MENIVTDLAQDKPTEEQIIKELNLMSEKFEGWVEFLAAVSEKYPEWSDFINAITIWLRLKDEPKEFWLDIIKESTKLGINDKVKWKSIDLERGIEGNKTIVENAIKNIKLNIKTYSHSKTLALIQEIREYHPVWKEKKGKSQKHQKSSRSRTPDNKVRRDSSSFGGEIFGDIPEEDKKSAEIARAKEEAAKKKKARLDELKQLQRKANETEDINELRGILNELKKYRQEFSLQSDSITRAIELKINEIERKKKEEGATPKTKPPSEFEDVKTYILLGITQGSLDIKEARTRLEKYASTFSSHSERCRIPSARLTNKACKQQAILEVYKEFDTKPDCYPISEGTEAYVIQQLTSLGISEQSATTLVIKNLCFLKHFQSAMGVINAFKAKYENIKIGEINDKQEQRRIEGQKEIMPQIIMNWERIVLEYRHKENSIGTVVIAQGVAK